MPSPFATAFRTYELVFPTGGGELVEDPETGLWRPAPGAETATLIATLQAAGSPELIEQIGIDQQEVALEGRCVKPMRLPAGVRDGDKCALTYGGSAGEFELRITDPDPIPAVEKALGERITGIWRGQRA